MALGGDPSVGASHACAECHCHAAACGFCTLIAACRNLELEDIPPAASASSAADTGLERGRIGESLWAGGARVFEVLREMFGPTMWHCLSPFISKLKPLYT